MAQRTIVSILDDIDGGKATQTVKFGIDGVEYEIDLSDKNAKKLRNTLATFAEHGRKLSRSGRPYRKVKVGPAARDVRAWARANGYDVPERGRVPREIREAFDKANVA